jgi:hypothetical protein
VIAVEKIGDGSVVIRTKDPAAAVYVWYRANLQNANGDTETKDGAHILYTRSGATVDIEPDAPGERGTNIGIVWNARKYGAYVPASGQRQPPLPK